MNSGAEAVENAVKIARYATGRKAIICFDDAFHGRTYMTLSLTSQVSPYKVGFGPYASEVYRIPYAYCYRCPLGPHLSRAAACECAEFLEQAFAKQVNAEEVAAVIAEPVQGEGGFIVPPPEYMGMIKKICDRHGILLIADEIQTGMGRTGNWFAMEHWGVEPDIMTTAKALGAGVPSRASPGARRSWTPSTPAAWGPPSAATPWAAAPVWRSSTSSRARAYSSGRRVIGDRIRARFTNFSKQFPVIGDVRGIGAMAAMELVEDPADEEAGRRLRQGLPHQALRERHRQRRRGHLPQRDPRPGAAHHRRLDSGSRVGHPGADARAGEQDRYLGQRRLTADRRG